MAVAEEVQFSLKVMMIKESNKVLYAGIDSDFAYVLLSFLTLPLGTIVRLLIKHYGDKAPILGSLNSLYAGLVNLDTRHFWTEAGKLMLLNPRNSSGDQCRRLKLQIDDTPLIQYFGYSDKYISIAFPNLKLNGIEDTSVLEERTLTVGLKEIMELLNGSLVSRTPTTDITLNISSAVATLNSSKKLPASVKCEPDALPQTQSSENISSDCKKITVKALVQKSTNKVLLAQSLNDFIDFLFSLLTIPLGRVQFLLGNNTCLWSINNLYRSVSNLEIGEYMMSRETMTRLLEPQIPRYYLSSYQIFSLNPQSSPTLYKRYENCRVKLSYTPTDSTCIPIKMIDPKGHDSFVKGPTTFMVTDDLVVSAQSSTFIISILNQLKIPVSDVEEHELNIGMEEALSILTASLASTSALTNGFKPFLKRQPKQEI